MFLFAQSFTQVGPDFWEIEIHHGQRQFLEIHSFSYQILYQVNHDFCEQAFASTGFNITEFEFD